MTKKTTKRPRPKLRKTEKVHVTCLCVFGFRWRRHIGLG